MATEKEINDAIAIVVQAAKDDRLQMRNTESIHYGEWETSRLGTRWWEYRAKPEPIEAWVIVMPDGRRSHWRTEGAAKAYAGSSKEVRLVHLKEVE